MRGSAVWAVAAGAFVAGFGVAEATGVRALGGVVLAAGGAWCYAALRRQAGTGRAAAVLALALALFVAAHPLGDAIGAWPAVLASAGVLALATRAAAA
jgi:hypothetical protein